MQNQRSSFGGTDFTTGPIMPMFIKYFLPFLFSFLLNSLYNTVDTIIIGHYVGSSGIVAVSMGGKMLSLFTIVGSAFAGGGQILISQLSGAKRKDDIKEAIGTLLTTLLGVSVVLGIVLIIFSRIFLTWLNTPAESLQDAQAYLIITSAGLPFMFGYTAVSAILRGKGDSRNPLIFIAIAAVVNVIGDLIFILAFNLGAAGTAIATVLGQAVSLIFSLVSLYRNRVAFDFDFKLKSFAIKKDKLAHITRLGAPLALRSFFIIATIVVLSGYINLLGLAEAAAYSVGEKILSLANMFAYASNQSVAGMVGQNYGAKNKERIIKSIRCGMMITLGAAVILSAAGILWSSSVFRLFTDDPAVLAYARPFMFFAALNLIIAAIQDPFDGFVTGIGRTVFSMIGGILDGVALRLTFTFLLAYALGMGLNGFFLANALSRLGPLIIDLFVFFKGKWKKELEVSE